MVASAVSLKLEELDGWFRGTERVVVAYSGGIDSSLVAASAVRTLGDRALAVTAVSPSLPLGELAAARRVAAVIGVRHRAVRTQETEREAYLANGVDRCYHCKSELYEVLGRVAEEAGSAVVLSGANLDDLGDYRPGLRPPPRRAFATRSSRWGSPRRTSGRLRGTSASPHGTSPRPPVCRRGSRSG